MTYTAPVAPIVGNQGIVFTLALIDPATGTPGPALAFDGDVSAVKGTPTDKASDDLTFREATAGDSQDLALTVTHIATFEPGSLMRLLWDNPGASFACVWGQGGNAIPTPAQPHQVGTVKAQGRPYAIEQTATKDTTRVKTDSVLKWLDVPTLLTA